MLFQVRLAAKRLLAPVIYRHPPVGLSPYRLYAYLDTLFQTRAIAGDVVEVGCSLCGTAALASRFLKQIGVRKRYFAIDTFSGFPSDEQAGISPRFRSSFSANSIALARTVLQMNKAGDVQLIQGDIVTLSSDLLPEQIAAALVDVDLYEPTTAALEKLLPRLSDGGVILVDDCWEETHWPARQAYLDFIANHGLPPRLQFGMGLVAR